MRKIQRYGCRPDIKDHRDILYRDTMSYMAIPLPKSVSLVAQLPACWDQGNIGSCTGHGTAGALTVLHKGFMPSRLMIYFNGRDYEGDVSTDNGCQIRDVIKGLANRGVCAEDLWPYDVAQFAIRPGDDAFQAALPNRITQYSRCESLFDVKNSLAQGYPVVIGFSVYEGFESPEVAKTGVLHLPNKNESIVGGHCVLVIGYDDNTGMVLVRNSWGQDWGINGNFWMDYRYFQHLVSDMWTIRA